MIKFPGYYDELWVKRTFEFPLLNLWEYKDRSGLLITVEYLPDPRESEMNMMLVERAAHYSGIKLVRKTKYDSFPSTETTLQPHPFYIGGCI